MGKYMRKAKITGEVAVMDVSPSTLGVRTRAKTLALQRQQQRAASPTSYLELRSRRLERPPVFVAAAASRYARRSKVASTTTAPVSWSVNSGAVKPVSAGDSKKKKCGKEEVVKSNELGENEVEASCGENAPDIDGRERNIRESTPCSMIRDSDTLETPGSTTKSTNSATGGRRKHSARHQDIPSPHEVEEFFAGAEQKQQRIFIEKYNFDPVNDLPLPGRYEWVRLDL